MTSLIKNISQKFGICSNAAAERSDGKALLLIHGAGGVKIDWPETWRTPAQELTHSFSNVMSGTTGGLDAFPVYAIDLPGHGDTSGPSHRKIGDYADAVLTELESMGLKRPILVGHSMGAGIALTAAAKAPELISGLCLLAGGARFNVSDKVLDGLQNAFEDTVDMLIGASWHRQIGVFSRQKARLRMRSVGQNTVYGDFLACSQFDMTSDLANIHAPVQIIAAREDIMVKLPILEETAAGLKTAQLEVLDNCGHFLHGERTPEVARLIAQFAEAL